MSHNPGIFAHHVKILKVKKLKSHHTSAEELLYVKLIVVAVFIILDPDWNHTSHRLMMTEDRGGYTSHIQLHPAQPSNVCTHSSLNVRKIFAIKMFLTKVQ